MKYAYDIESLLYFRYTCKMSFIIDHSSEHPEDLRLSSKLNWLRAAVLGANDGIVSTAGVVVGVAAASHDKTIILTAGLAALVAGALSMAVGEYVSVSSQRDTEKALIEKERIALQHEPEAELEELIRIYKSKGLSKKTASLVARELTEHDAFAAHLDADLKIDPTELVNPWHAAIASALAFTFGGIFPIIATVLAPTSLETSTTFISVLIVLIVIGILSAWVGGAKKLQAVARVVVGGTLAMAITFAAGSLFNLSGL